MQSRFHVNETPFFSVFYGLLELLWNPGIVIFHDELGHLRPLGWRESFNFLNDFLRGHISNYPQKTASGKSPLPGEQLSPSLSPRAAGRLQFWDVEKGETFLYCDAFCLGAWLVLEPDGRFDGTPEALRYLCYTE